MNKKARGRKAETKEENILEGDVDVLEGVSLGLRDEFVIA